MNCWRQEKRKKNQIEECIIKLKRNRCQIDKPEFKYTLKKHETIINLFAGLSKLKEKKGLTFIGFEILELTKKHEFLPE